ncbi:LapA family protein [Blastomonas sp. AAP53]|uniref:LapA family protein n=1 Tax=Blastomonas sp. AAP53 TaxID=1248760 RepID=UPI000301914C|nr:LapA family protein [Blastomonas sp. AAP53]
MQFLKTLVIIMLAVVFIVFAYNNWQAVTVDLWGGLQLVTKLPVLLFLTFAGGFLPLWAYHRTANWRLKRRIATLESNQARTTTAAVAPAPMQAEAAADRPAEPESVLRSV